MKMLYLDGTESLSKPTVVCLGFFDGVHIGHAQLIGRAKAIAAEAGYDSCVHTFDRMPAQVLRPEEAALELTPLAQKAQILEAMGVQVLAISRFTDTMDMRATAFFEDILRERLCARHIVVGFHHHFGRRGEGDVKALEALCARDGIGLDIISPVTLAGGELVSSTAIRAALAAGDTARAAQMLGRPCVSNLE